jgi:hypothetical protein
LTNDIRPPEQDELLRPRPSNRVDLHPWFVKRTILMDLQLRERDLQGLFVVVDRPFCRASRLVARAIYL